MHQIDIDKAKTQMPSLIESALDGEEVVITKNNQPILKIVRVSGKDEPSFLNRRDEPVAKPHRKSGSARGLISMSDDFDEPLGDFAEYMQ